MTDLTLYELIKQKSQEKGRPLKIVCDWDECLQILKPVLIYELLKGPKPEFKEFWKEFWESVDMTAGSVGSKINDYRGPRADKVKQAIKEQRKILEESRDWNLTDKAKDNFYLSSHRFEAPFLTTADGILEAVKEDYVSELVIISSTLSEKNGIDVTGKRAKAERSFGKLPIKTEISISLVKRDSDGRLRPHRWEVIRDKFPDFDMYIDDNPSLVANSPSTLKYMNQIPNIKDKIFVLNDYKSNLKVKGPNIYHIKTEVSDLTNKDFEIAALELKMKDLEKQLQEQKTQKSNLLKQPSTYLLIASGIAITLLGIGIYWFIKNKYHGKKNN